ncbi:hypothetical protein WN55_04412 [Dufourea novaeangliae]|uniref:Uncharacterized protein n=1 Tax=Dufourea novaeangliae TaxID=178035 RepID=A0A154PN54_DUFNO|nr:hypothetical protein WN55_04412 [Dufourea novaeangliae]
MNIRTSLARLREWFHFDLEYGDKVDDVIVYRSIGKITPLPAVFTHGRHTERCDISTYVTHRCIHMPHNTYRSVHKWVACSRL